MGFIYRVGKDGFYAVTGELGNVQYPIQKKLECSLEEGFEISRKERHFPQEWICYSMSRPSRTNPERRKEVAFVRGYHIGSNRFHIQRIKNLLNDRISGRKYIPQIIDVMDSDLRDEGVEVITAAVYLKLAPIAMRSYGFKSKNGKSALEIKKSPWRKVRKIWTSLEKRLI